MNQTEVQQNKEILLNKVQSKVGISITDMVAYQLILYLLKQLEKVTSPKQTKIMSAASIIPDDGTRYRIVGTVPSETLNLGDIVRMSAGPDNYNRFVRESDFTIHSFLDKRDDYLIVEIVE